MRVSMQVHSIWQTYCCMCSFSFLFNTEFVYFVFNDLNYWLLGGICHLKEGRWEMEGCICIAVHVDKFSAPTFILHKRPIRLSIYIWDLIWKKQHKFIFKTAHGNEVCCMHGVIAMGNKTCIYKKPKLSLWLILFVMW